MINIETGHRYELQHFGDVGGKETVTFYKMNNEQEANTGAHDGTTNEEVLKMMIDRMNYLQKAFPCRENAIVITKLEESLMWLNKRTEDRKARGVEGQHKI